MCLTLNAPSIISLWWNHHGMAWVGKALEDHLVSTPVLWAGLPTTSRLPRATSNLACYEYSVMWRGSRTYFISTSLQKTAGYQCLLYLVLESIWNTHVLCISYCDTSWVRKRHDISPHLFLTQRWWSQCLSLLKSRIYVRSSK